MNFHVHCVCMFAFYSTAVATSFSTKQNEVGKGKRKTHTINRLNSIYWKSLHLSKFIPELFSRVDFHSHFHFPFGLIFFFTSLMNLFVFGSVFVCHRKNPYCRLKKKHEHQTRKIQWRKKENRMKLQ